MAWEGKRTLITTVSLGIETNLFSLTVRLTCTNRLSKREVSSKEFAISHCDIFWTLTVISRRFYPSRDTSKVLFQWIYAFSVLHRAVWRTCMMIPVIRLMVVKLSWDSWFVLITFPRFELPESVSNSLDWEEFGCTGARRDRISFVMWCDVTSLPTTVFVVWGAQIEVEKDSHGDSSSNIDPNEPVR